MNCKPDQLAWIKVPKHQNLRGIEQLNNRVVRTVRLLGGTDMPTWVVTPEQSVVITQLCRDPHGEVLEPGDRCIADGIPDSYLRPFDPNSEPLDEPASRELEHTA